MTNPNIAAGKADFNHHSACAAVFLQCDPAKILAKQFFHDDCEGYGSAYRFDAATVPIAGLDDLAGLLSDAVHRPRLCVVRGELVNGERATGIRRRIHDDPKTGEKAALQDAARRWIALDLDGLDLPAGIDPRDIAACARSIMPALPAAFRGVRCVVQATANHSIQSGARLRLWYWLSQQLTCRECKQWLKGYKAIDASIYTPVAVHYTAAPIFLDGRPDPLPIRVAVLEGAETVHVPPPEELAPPDPPAVASGCAPLTHGRLDGIVRAAANAPEGQRNARLHWAACRLGEAITKGEIEKGVAEELLAKAGEHAGLIEDEYKPTIASGLAAGRAAAEVTEFEGEIRQ